MASAQLLTASGEVLDCPQGAVLLVGRGDAALRPHLVLRATQSAPVEVSTVALEIFCHATNLAVRVHQRAPGYLVADVADSFRAGAPRRQTVEAGATLLIDGPLAAFVLRLGEGSAAEEIPVGDVTFTPAAWTQYAGAEPTRVRGQRYPREQWARWIVAAFELWSAGGGVVPTESATKDLMRSQYPQWPTRTPAEPRRAVLEALHYQGFDPHAPRPDGSTPPPVTWRTGLEDLFGHGWPRAELVEWVHNTRDETGWAPVGLGGRQAPPSRRPWR